MGWRVRWSILGPAKSTAPMGEVDHGTLSPCAFLSSEDLTLSVVNLARSAHLTFLDLYDHWFNVFIWGARGSLAHLRPYSLTVLSEHNSASLCALGHNWALQCRPNKTAVWHPERRRPNPLCPPTRENLNCWLTNNILSKGSVTSWFWNTQSPT